MKNPTLVKNMKDVKWKAIPPLKGPDPRGLIKDKKQDKPIILEKTNGRNRYGLTYRKTRDKYS